MPELYKELAKKKVNISIILESHFIERLLLANHTNIRSVIKLSLLKLAWWYLGTTSLRANL